ncbi:MAG TPA: hypothetical protein PL045_02875, partial [Chitinophagaceae bacterium]|nr:hypothetical protein [Chitinophagaceae bacterium]
ATPEIAATLLPALTVAIEKTRADDALATEDTSGQSDKKDELRNMLEESAFHISSAIASYADDIDDFVLMNAVDFTISQLEKFRDEHLLQFCDYLLLKANDATINSAIIHSHNVTAGNITELQNTTDDYRRNIAGPGLARGTKVAYGKLVDRDLDNIDDILDKIRRKMRTYRFTNRLLYDTFVAIDKIDDTGAHHSAITGDLAAGQTVAINAIAYDAAATLKLQSTGTGALDFQFTLSGSPSGSIITVAGGSTVTILMQNMAPAGDSITVKNNSSVEGNYRITVL